VGNTLSARPPFAHSLFDVEDTDEVPAVRAMTVAPVGTADVREFVNRYHYTGFGESMSWRWGLWHGVTLWGVIAYNLPTPAACASVFGPDHIDAVWHMTRLALADQAPHNSESRLIGGSLRAIERDHPDVWGVLTYADAAVGHIGYVYQATNALYTGTGGNAVYFLDALGRRRSPYQSPRWVTPEDGAARGWSRHIGPPKHRYVYVLGSTRTARRHRRSRLLLPVLPYPKTVDARTE
jgi:hypothetical protein